MTQEEKLELLKQMNEKILSVDELYEALNMILEGVTDETGTA